MSGNIRYDQLKSFVDKGVTPVCKALFWKRFNELRTSEFTPDTWTVEKFLEINRDNLLSTKEGREKEWILFPLQPAHTDVNKWHPTVTCFVLKETCNLNKVLRTNLQMLTEYLDGIGKFQEDKNENSFAELKIIIGVCLDELRSDQLSKSINDLTENLERKKISKEQNTSNSNKPREILQKIGRTTDAEIVKKDHERLDRYNDKLKNLFSRLELLQPGPKLTESEKPIEMETEIPKTEIEMKTTQDFESLKMLKLKEQPQVNSQSVTEKESIKGVHAL